MDNIANRNASEFPDWIIVGLRYFNVYGPREAHKGVPASMIYHLSRQMKAGKRPRIFKHGEQQRDFVYVKDIVEGTIRAADAKQSGIYNLGSGTARSFNDLVDILNQSLGTKFEAGIHRQSPRALSELHSSGPDQCPPWPGVRTEIYLRDRRGRLHEVALSDLRKVAQR